VNTAENWCRAGLALIGYVNRYTLASLHSFIFDAQYRAETMAEVEVRMDALDERDRRIITCYRHYLDN
jgi:hypothetical protein